MMSSSSSSSDVTDIFELAMLAKGYEMVLSLEEKEKKRKRRRIARNRPPVETPLQTPNYNYTPQPFLLPYSRVDCTLRALAGQAEGFGRFAIGGLHGPIYRVTTLSDDGPGSLRDGCGKKEPLWIVFEVSGTIELSSNLNVLSYKTIDGRGQRIKLTGKGLRLKECEHVIICNLEFEGGRGPGVDGIHIKSNSKHIWIDRCSLKDYDDGLINITRESTNITISRCYFSNHDKTMLIGADASHHDDRSMCVTIHRCFFDGTRQRHPRVRFAKVHLYNNYTRHWGVSAVCASVESQIFSQFNIYEAGQHKVAFKYLTEKAGDKEEARTGCIISEGDHFMLGTQPGLLEPTATSSLFHPIQHYQTWTIEPATNWLQYILLHYSGWQAIARPPGHDEIPRPLGKSRATKVARSSSSSDVSSKRDEFNDGVAKELRELRIVKTMEIQFRRRFRKLEFLCTPTNDMEPEDRAEVERIKAEIRAEFDAESNN